MAIFFSYCQFAEIDKRNNSWGTMGSSKYFTAGAVSIHDLDDNDDDEDDRLKVCNEHQKPFLNTSKMEQAKNDNPKIEWNV